MLVYQGTKAVWIPAFAGMTMVGSKRLRRCDSPNADEFELNILKTSSTDDGFLTQIHLRSGIHQKIQETELLCALANRLLNGIYLRSKHLCQRNIDKETEMPGRLRRLIH